jgi:hypothetical protein
MFEEIVNSDYKDCNCVNYDLDENSYLQLHEMCSQNNMCTFEENKELELEEKKNDYDFCYKPSNDFSEKPTGDKTSKFEIDFDKNKNVFSPKFVVTNEDTDTDDDSSINFYSYKKIQEIFAKKKNFTQIRQKFKKN